MRNKHPLRAGPSIGRASLRRSLSLPLLTLYGLGVTIGAGIYVLIGEAAARAGTHAPFAFVLSAIVIAPTAASFAELSSRYPVSAGEAAFVKAGFSSPVLSLFVGCLVIAVGVISAAAITLGAVGYIQQFITVSDFWTIIAILVLMGGIAVYGILESVSFAAVMTLIEIAGLFLIIIAGFFWGDISIAHRLGELVPNLSDSSHLAGLFAASMVTVFAFIGFEDMVNVAEETVDPQTVLPRAIFLTLLITTIIYFLVAIVAVLSVPIAELSTSRAPLSLVFERVGHMSPTTISGIAIIATLNGVIVQIIMAARVVYGLATQGSLPKIFTHIHPNRRTPMNATILIVIAIAVLAVAFPLGDLVSATSRVALVSFALVNISLVRIKISKRHYPAPKVSFGIWVPLAGFISCIGLLGADAFSNF